MNIKQIKDAFQMTTKEKTSRNFSQDRKTVKRSLVKKFSSGNVNLQLGRYSTESDIDKRRDSVCKYKFTD